MTERKEPGQLAHDAFYARRPQPWEDVPEQFRADWAAVEAAIYEDAAKCAERATSYDDALQKSHGLHTSGQRIAAAIRAKIGGSHG